MGQTGPMGYKFPPGTAEAFMEVAETVDYVGNDTVDLSLPADDDGLDLADPDNDLRGVLDEASTHQPGTPEFVERVTRGIEILRALQEDRPDARFRRDDRPSGAALVGELVRRGR